MEAFGAFQWQNTAHCILSKGDRNPHEVSSDESPPAEIREHQTKGGGHRSGSRGAGTLENSDGKRLPRQGPKGKAS